jgi:hypothetical protein
VLFGLVVEVQVSSCGFLGGFFALRWLHCAGGKKIKGWKIDGLFLSRPRMSRWSTSIEERKTQWESDRKARLKRTESVRKNGSAV